MVKYTEIARFTTFKETLCVGHAFAPILQNMKCEEFTYSAHETDYSVSRGAGPQAARCLGAPLEASPGALAPARNSHILPDAVFRMWAWMQLYLRSYGSTLASYAAGVTQTPPRSIFVQTANNDAPPIQINLNRKMLRRMRRRARLKPTGRSMRHYNLTQYQAEKEPPLCPRTYREYMIRVYRCSRPLIYGLCGSLGDHRRRVMMAVGLQGNGASLQRTMSCNALITPD